MSQTQSRSWHGLAATGVAALWLASMPNALAAPGRDLKIAFVDVEGGAATLYVTPQGHSLLVDTGWPPGTGGSGALPQSGDNAEQIAAAAKRLGVTRLDYLLITHYHVDHVGGLEALLARLPVGTFLDHGPNRQAAPDNPTPQQRALSAAYLYQRYEAAVAGKQRRTMKPGDQLEIDDLLLTVVNSDRAVIAAPLPGAGQPNPACIGMEPMVRDGGEENPRSVGFVATYGKARILALGDTTWNVEMDLVCPNSLIGAVDLLVTSHHGSGRSTSPALVAGIRPTIAITDNGETKGADAESFDRLKQSATLKDIWHLHFATRSPQQNPPPDLIANLSNGADAHNGLMVNVEKSGTLTVSSDRNGFSRVYPKRFK